LIAEVLENFLVYVDSLQFDAKPDYDRCRKMFRVALQESNHPLVLTKLEIIDAHGMKIMGGGGVQTFSKIPGGQGFQEKLAGGLLSWVLLLYYLQVFQKFAWEVLYHPPLIPSVCIYAQKHNLPI
jgi:hypothetical protein